MHVYELSGDQVKNAIDCVVESFKWRVETRIADLTHNDLSPGLKEKGSLFMHNVDKWNKRMLVFDVKKHIKGKEKMEDMKKHFLYYVERIEKETGGDKLTMVFDCHGSGLKNMDLEFTQYQIGVFTKYTPYNLNYILVFDMPWVLNAGWKIIKGWLPKSGVEKIKFLNAKTMGEYVTNDNMLKAWGGTDDWEYTFVPEQPRVDNALKMEQHPMENNRFESVQDFGAVNGGGDIVDTMPPGGGGGYRKAVQFNANAPPDTASIMTTSSSVSRSSSCE